MGRHGRALEVDHVITPGAWRWIAIVLVGACGGAEPPAESPPPREETTAALPGPVAPPSIEPTAPAASAPPAPALDITDAAKRYVAESTAAWASRDPKKHTALYTPDGVVGFPGAKGWEEMRASEMESAVAEYFAAFPDLKLTITRVIGKANVAVAEWVFVGTNRGELSGKKATNKKAAYRGASVLSFAPDGRLKRESIYFDMATMMGQLGLGPKGQPVRAPAAVPSAPAELAFAKEGESASEAVARSWLTMVEKGDPKALVALATDDIVVSNQYMPSDTKGKKALEKEIAEGSKAFVDQKVAIAICVPAAEVVACEYTWQATWKGAAMGMKPTGKTGTVHSLEIIQLDHGKVARTVGYGNGTEFASSFGLTEAKP